MLKQNDSFGDVAILHNPQVKSLPTTYPQTIQACPDTHIAFIHREDFLKVLKKRNDEDYLKLANFIQSIPAFSSMNNVTAFQLRKIAMEEKFLWNQTVFAQGEKTQKIYIVMSREFEISR